MLAVICVAAAAVVVMMMMMMMMMMLMLPGHRGARLVERRNRGEGGCVPRQFCGLIVRRGERGTISTPTSVSLEKVPEHRSKNGIDRKSVV